MDASYIIIRRLRENLLLRERTEYDALSDIDLIKKAQEGDMYATSLAIERYEDNGFLGRMCSKFFVPGEDHEDTLQIAREGLWDAIASWDGSGNFEAFAGMVIKRKLTVFLQSALANKRMIHNNATSMNQTSDDGEGNESEFGDTIASKEGTPEEEYINKEAEDRIYNYIKSRSKLEQDAIMLFIKGYKIPEIADKLGKPYKSIENALGRMRVNLRAYLNSLGYNESLDPINEATVLNSLEKRVLKNIFNKIVDRGI